MDSENGFVVFSVAQAGKTQAENVAAAAFIERKLRAMRVPFHSCLGCYKGVRELSFMLEGQRDNLYLATLLALDYHQETILVCRADKTCYLVDPETATSIDVMLQTVVAELGRWRPIHRSTAGYLEGLGEAWTLCEGEYYVCG